MITTLFMLTSLDGKISTGAGDERDFDKDLPTIPGVAEGLDQYYELEQQTDPYSFNTGKVMAKVGWNNPKDSIDEIPVTFVIVDNQPHLTDLGVQNLISRCKKLVIVTTNASHPALALNDNKLEVISYEGTIDFVDLFKRVEKLGADRMTIQSGGDMNATLLRLNLINEVSIVIAPILVGGVETPSLIGGESLLSQESLKQIKTLEIIKTKTLENNYLNLRYKVIQS